MNKNLSTSLKIMALIFWWYIPVFVFSVLPLLDIQLPQLFFTEFRGAEYQWDFELMFTLIFAVWGWYLWKVSQKPEESQLFIRFSIFATIAHIVGMVIIGFVRINDLTHMLKDAVVMSVPLFLVTYYYYKRVTTNA